MDCFELTESQQGSVRKFNEFLKSDSQVFILRGAAGTGKTTLVSEFLRILDTEKRDFVLMAPTGRAAYIIGNKTGRDASTIHRGIYALANLKSTSQHKDDEDDGGLHLRYGLKSNEDSLKAVYLVDEASMIPDSFAENEAFSFGSGCLLTDLFEFARGRKIVFIGDYAQLPPVGMNFSPALDKEYIEKKFSCTVSEITLREVVRQSSDGVMLSNATKIREGIENKSFIEFRLSSGSDSVNEDVDLLNPYYLLSPNKPNVKSAIIAYGNKQALDYNLSVRRHYYGSDSPRLNSGELLIICRNNYSHVHELYNGNIVQVESCQPDSEVLKREVRVKIGKDRIESVVLKFRRVTIKFRSYDQVVSLNILLLDNFLDDPNGMVGGLLARALIVDFNNRLPEPLKSRYSEIQRLLRSKSKLTIREQELCEIYKKLLKADPYYNALICKYGYAITCHKAQGGEWDNVFVDMSRFGGTANEDYFRWAYTALTRASKKIWLFRSPDFDYISDLVVEDIKQATNLEISTYSPDADFCKTRFERLSQICLPYNISVNEDLSKPYQHIITFSDINNDKVVFQLWYKAKGYNGKETVLSANSNEFADLCKGLLEESFIPMDIPFEAVGRPFAQRLVEHMKAQIEEVGIQLLNITQEQYKDVFHLKTDGLAKVGFNYTSKGNYTYMTLNSSLGLQDAKLKALRQRFL